jgi:hypothetical protein
MLKKQPNNSVRSIALAFVYASLLLFAAGCDDGSNGDRHTSDAGGAGVIGDGNNNGNPKNTDGEPATNKGEDSDPTVWKDVNGVEALRHYLAGKPENTETTPYRVRVNNVNLSTRSIRGDTLRTLYDALIRYVELDLSGSTGETISNITTNVAPNKSNIVSIILPKSITTVSTNVFSGCTNLISASLPGATSVAHGAFASLTRLESVYMPEVRRLNGTNTASSGTFFRCLALTTVEMPNIEFIGNHAFASSGIVSVTLGDVPPVLDGSDVFRNTRSFSDIFVPVSALATYQSIEEENWSALRDRIKPIQ